MGLQDANGVENLTRLSDYLSGSQETGNAQTDKDGNPLANVVPSKLGEKMKWKKSMKQVPMLVELDILKKNQLITSNHKVHSKEG